MHKRTGTAQFKFARIIIGVVAGVNLPTPRAGGSQICVAIRHSDRGEKLLPRRRFFSAVVEGENPMIIMLVGFLTGIRQRGLRPVSFHGSVLFWT
jgi:hypothetical protein